MPVTVHQIRLPLDAPEEALLDAALKKGRLRRREVRDFRVLRRSLDRRRRTPVFCWSVELALKGEPNAAPEPGWTPPEAAKDGRLEHRPVVIGTGPAGLFAGWLLAERGYRPIVLERGSRMNERVRSIRELNEDRKLDPESNYLFGEGGAGTFSDGKLTTRSKDPRARWVLEAFRERTSVEQVVWDYRPHLGSDRIRRVVGRMRMEIERAGGEIRYRTPALGVNVRDGAVRGVRTPDGEIAADVVVLGPGHSARDLYRALLSDGVPMSQKPFQLGFRVEHPQPWVDERIWGPAAGHESLGPADYRMSVKLPDAATAYSFCMCPGGEIIPAVADGEHMNTNGMSWSAKATGFANSGLVTTLEPEDFGDSSDPLAGLVLQERHERVAAEIVDGSVAVPAQRLVDWKESRRTEHLPESSCRSGMVSADLDRVVPPVVARRLRTALDGFERQMSGFHQPDALLVGPECRSSSPVRLERDPETLMSPGIAGLFPVGEGAGYAGGIISAAIDGLRAAERVCLDAAPPR